MKKVIATIAILATILTTSIAMAKDVMIEKTLTKMIEKTDKDGNQYRILIVKIKKDLNGVEYYGSLPIMAFSDTIEMTDNLVVGEEFKAIVSTGTYKGRDTATLMAIVE